MSHRRARHVAQEINAQTWMSRAASRLVERDGYERFDRNVISHCDAELLRLHHDRQPAVLVFMHVSPFLGISSTVYRLALPVLIIAWTWRYRGPTPMEIYMLKGPGASGRWPLKRGVDKLREGGQALWSVDTPGNQEIRVKLLARSFAFARTPFALARLTGALLIPMAARWTRGRRIEVIIGDTLCPAGERRRPSEFTKEEGSALDQRLADKTAEWYERIYCNHPEQLSIGMLRCLCAQSS
jgi:hypothetical protein